MSSFKEDVEHDLKSIAMFIGMALFMGGFLCVYMNNMMVAMSSSAMGSMMGNMYVTMYNRVMCVVPMMMICAMGTLTLAIRPRMAGMKEQGTIKSHVTAVFIALLIVEIVIMLLQIAVILIRNGNMDGYAYVPYSYICNIAIGLGFCAVGIVTSRFLKPRAAMGITMVFAFWSMFVSMVGIMGVSTMVAAGAGAEWCSNVYYFTITGFVDVNSLVTIGTDSVDYNWLMNDAILFIIDFVLIGLAAWKDRKDAQVGEPEAPAAPE